MCWKCTLSFSEKCENYQYGQKKKFTPFFDLPSCYYSILNINKMVENIEPFTVTKAKMNSHLNHRRFLLISSLFDLVLVILIFNLCSLILKNVFLPSISFRKKLLYHPRVRFPKRRVWAVSLFLLFYNTFLKPGSYCD